MEVNTLSHLRYVAYYRVSTKQQGASGLGLDAQREAVSQHLRSVSDAHLVEFVEVESGKRKDRPELEKAVRLCRLTGATLIIAKLDRLARNVAFVSALMDNGIDFVACDNPQANRLTLHILAAVAEDEARRISERTKSALSAAKTRGTKLGGDRGYRPSGRPEIALRALVDRTNRFACENESAIREIVRAGASSFAKIAIELNSRGIRTRRGGRWHASTVRNLIRRLDAIEVSSS